MIKNNTLRYGLWACWFLVLYFLLQTVTTLAVAYLFGKIHQMPFEEVMALQQLFDQPQATSFIIWSSLSSGLLCILLFPLLRYSPFACPYPLMRRGKLMFWICILALSSLLPSIVLNDLLGLNADDRINALFTHIMQHPLGYLTIGIMAPLVEEVIFRGAILRVLRRALPANGSWFAIIITAFLFAIAHGNMEQGVHAFLMGILLGWLYVHTGSIFPSFVCHWINNTVTYLFAIFRPDLSDKSAIDLFQGSHLAMYASVSVASLIFIYTVWKIAKYRFDR